MVFVIAGVRSFVGRGGIKGVDGRAAVGAANYHYVNGTSAHSLFGIAPPPRARSRMEAWRKGEFQRMTCGQPFSFVQGKFSNSGDHVITLCHNHACVMRYLPCQAWILQMEIRVENCH